MIGIRIAKDGSTVKDSSDKQYVDTDEPLFKLFLSDKGSLSLATATLTASPQVVIKHDLGYIPMFFVYMDRADNSQRRLVMTEDTTTVGSQILCSIQVDKKNITILVTGSSVTGTFGYNYQIYYDKVGE